MKINAFYLFVVIFLVVMILTSIYYPLRYLRYFLPLVPLVVFYDKISFKIHRRILSYYLTYLFFYSFVIVFFLLYGLVCEGVSSRFWPNAVFLVAPLLFILFLLPSFDEHWIKRYVLTMFYVNIGIFLMEEWRGVFALITNFSVFRNALLTSTFPTESNLAYVFGFFVLFFFTEKYRKRYQIVAFIFFILCFKRVVILAVLASIGVFVWMRWRKTDMSRARPWWTIVGVAVNAGYIWFTYALVAGLFDDWVYKKTGFSTDALLMGRQTFYTEAFEKVGAFNLVGPGLGKVDEIIFTFFGKPVNLHSEVLRSYLEFGAILFFIWLLLLFYNNLFSNKAASMFIYFNVLILTDNVFIYFEVMFYFYFFILIFLWQRFKHSPAHAELNST